ncbi:MAG TPA: DeoR/GlpR transcriptional regulator [Firmicutes bacterium]|jgi:DeoR/GlpR family transcriptional regulator of sugar metabolism|nr:DeoR/GlpR transcriptional regulator [Bacillota bacterium]
MTQNIQESILPAERRKRILEYIQQNGSGRIEELATTLGVSEATVRRDLSILDTEGFVDRTHGGAVLPETSTAFERLYPEKRALFSEEKQAIGLKAATMVSDGETLILDSGSTTFEIARNLIFHKNLTIITYDLFIASSFIYDPSTTVIVTGGVRRDGFNVLIGPIAEELLRQVKVNKAFIGADAVDFTQGITNATFTEVSIKRLIIEAANEVVLVADHSKFGKLALAKVCSLNQIQHIVTDQKLDDSILQGIQRLEIPLTIVQAEEKNL